MTGLSITIYRPDFGDCTNGGVTAPKNAKSKTFVVFDEKIDRGNYTLDECMANPDRFVCFKIERRQFSGETYMNLKLMNPKKGKWYMDGGNLGYTSDSRFREVTPYPLAIHDRTE